MIAGVFAPAMISTVVCLTMLGLSRTLTRTARVPPDHPAVRRRAYERNPRMRCRLCGLCALPGFFLP